MISEKQVIDFLKNKDNKYIENLISSLSIEEDSIDAIGDSKKSVLFVDVFIL